MASSCCEPRQSCASARWQPAQVSLPTKVAAAALAMFLFDPFKSRYPRPIATTITAASAAAVQILCFHSRLKLDRGSCGSLVCIAPAELFRDPLFLADLGRLGVIGPRHFSNTCAPAAYVLSSLRD